jgi:D-glycero-D-manno-heptose 1,7-bisphosphate phosphatase
VVFKNNSLICYDKVNITSDMDYIDYGISVLNRSVIEAIPEGHTVDLAEIYTNLVKDRSMAGIEVRKRFYEIGTPSSLEEFKKYINERIYTPSPFIFLDRDGTINEIVFNEDTENLDSPLSAEQLVLLPGTEEALKIFKSLGYSLVIVTNQPAAAKGKVTLGKLYEVNSRLKSMLSEKGIYLDDILMCALFLKERKG